MSEDLTIMKLAVELLREAAGAVYRDSDEDYRSMRRDGQLSRRLYAAADALDTARLHRLVHQIERERDEARAECERLRKRAIEAADTWRNGTSEGDDG